MKISRHIFRLIMITLVAIIASLLFLLVATGCTYTRIGVDHATGNRHIFTLGLPTQIEGNGIQADNRINIFEGMRWDK